MFPYGLIALPFISELGNFTSKIIGSNDGYITDSLGWALYKLKRYSKAKKYLQLAVQLMPSDPIINDHFGDCLWMTGNKLQARYYWNYVSKLENATEDQKEKIKKKIFEGPKL